MSSHKANHVERLLVYPGHDCACCVGRFGFENGIRSLTESHAVRTQNEILNLNPLYIRQLPSFRHQEVHVETMMAAMGVDLPKLFKRWRKHLQTYPEMSYLLHFILASQSNRSLVLSLEILDACKQASPFKLEQPEWHEPLGFSLKKRWSSLEIVQEILLRFMELLDLPSGFGRDGRHYLSQLAVMSSHHLDALQPRRSTRVESSSTPRDTSREENEQRRNAARYLPTIIDGAYRNLAETIIPAMIRAHSVIGDQGALESIHTLLVDFFDAGGSYNKSHFDIAGLVLEVEPELLLILDRHRNKLNSVSTAILESNLEEINRNLETRRAEAAARRERRQAEILRQQAEQEEQEREHQRTEAERAKRRAAVQAARSESLSDMTQRLSSLAPVARMQVIVKQIGYAPASFPDDWARSLGDEDIDQLDSATVETLIERTRGVQRGEWKALNRRLVTREQQ